MSLIKLKNNALDNLTSFEGSASLGDMVFISSATASSSASIEFDLGSYKEYKFFFVNIHPSVESYLTFNFSTDNGSNYNVTKTSTAFGASHSEDDVYTNFYYIGGADLAQSTSDQRLSPFLIYIDNDSNLSGMMSVFNPSSSTYVKHFMAEVNYDNYGVPRFPTHDFVAGYANTTSALTNIKFQMSSGNIDDGKILCFGIN